jgi:pimeloyl-ACP methyl ester carboxylesterase
MTASCFRLRAELLRLASLLVLFCFAPGESALTQDKTLYGTLDVEVRVFRFVINVDKEGKGRLTSLDEGGREFPLDDFAIHQDKLSFQLKATRARYHGKFSQKSKAYQGLWQQSQKEFDLAFRVVDKVPVDSPKEVWEGEIQAAGQKLLMRFRIYDGQAKHPLLFDSPSQRAGGFTGTVATKGGNTIYGVPAVRGTFTGKLSEDQKSLKGTWNQGADLPLELKRVSAKDLQKPLPPPKRPQTPQAPFPYESHDVSIDNNSAKLTLAATLTVPKQGKRFPCVILISGSGAQDRDETLMGHKPFWVIADHLSRNGIAVLRFDDRGTAQSTGVHRTATTADFATDVSAIVDFLKDHRSIDPKQIGLCGHSEGGLIGPLVASQRKDIAFVIMLAGPGVNGEKIIKNQQRLLLKASGVKERDIEVAAFLQNRLVELAKPNETIDDQQLEDAVDQLIKNFPEQGKEKKAIIAQAKAGIQQLSSPWMQYFLKHEPAPTLAKVKCPVLVLNGSKDRQVDPELNFPAIKAAFKKSGKENYQIVLLDNLNHLFQNCGTGAISEYQTIEETFAPEALNHISKWITTTTR